MPADLVKGETAEDVAAYVAFASSKTGEDEGRLADIGVKKAEGTAKVENGTLNIPAAESGALAYEFASAEAAPGSVKITSPNESTVPHNIALEGGGLNEIGPVVQGGGVSEITAELKAGEYTFYCSVPGHREGGMLGKLTVK
jgi:plastocyanin